MPTPTRLHVTPLEDRTTPAVLDLTTHGSAATLGDARFVQYDARPTGTGRIDSFLRVQGASAKGAVQQGYNTDARPLQFDENRSPQFTRSLRVSELPVVDLGGVRYREFLLDINQKSSQPLLSLDGLKVFVGQSGNLRGYDGSTLGGLSPVFDLDAGGDNWVKLDYRLNTGSGSGDMLFHLKDSLFAGGSYVYLYSRFGEHYAANAGFQEWAAGVGAAVTDTSGAISGTAFYDANQSGGLDAGEQGITDMVVYLDANNNGQYDPDEVYAVTDALGQYKFEQLAVGSMYGYSVRAVQPSDGLTQTTADPEIIFLHPGELRSHVDFGFYEPYLPG